MRRARAQLCLVRRGNLQRRLIASFEVPAASASRTRSGEPRPVGSWSERSSMARHRGGSLPKSRHHPQRRRRLTPGQGVAAPPLAVGHQVAGGQRAESDLGRLAGQRCWAPWNGSDRSLHRSAESDAGHGCCTGRRATGRPARGAPGNGEGRDVDRRRHLHFRLGSARAVSTGRRSGPRPAEVDGTSGNPGRRRRACTRPAAPPACDGSRRSRPDCYSQPMPSSSRSRCDP